MDNTSQENRARFAPYQIDLFCEDYNPHQESLFDVELDDIISTFALEKKELLGWCNVGALKTRFSISQSNLREDVVAELTNSINRQRQLICTLSVGLFQHPYASLPQTTAFINENDLKLYTAEANSSLFKHLKENIRPDLFFYSEFFGPEHHSGEIINGIQHQDLQNTSFEDAFFDIVLTAEVFEHIPDALRAEREVIRILKKGGIYCFTVPFAPLSPEDIVLADLDEQGQIRYYQAPQYHGDPVRPEQGILVYRIFSYNGMKSRFEKLDCKFSTYLFWSKTLGILGKNCFTHLVRRGFN